MTGLRNWIEDREMKKIIIAVTLLSPVIAMAEWVEPQVYYGPGLFANVSAQYECVKVPKSLKIEPEALGDKLSIYFLYYTTAPAGSTLSTTDTRTQQSTVSNATSAAAVYGPAAAVMCRAWTPPAGASLVPCSPTSCPSTPTTPPPVGTCDHGVYRQPCAVSKQVTTVTYNGQTYYTCETGSTTYTYQCRP